MQEDLRLGDADRICESNASLIWGDVSYTTLSPELRSVFLAHTKETRVKKGWYTTGTSNEHVDHLAVESMDTKMPFRSSATTIYWFRSRLFRKRLFRCNQHSLEAAVSAHQLPCIRGRHPGGQTHERSPFNRSRLVALFRDCTAALGVVSKVVFSSNQLNVLFRRRKAVGSVLHTVIHSYSFDPSP